MPYRRLGEPFRGLGRGDRLGNGLGTPGGAGGAVPWYLAGGAPAPLAAWQAVGAASKAASLVNLVNPGTYDLTETGTVVWNTATGWDGAAGANAYLRTGITPELTYTMLIRVAGLEDVLGESVMGCQDLTNGFEIHYTGSGNIYFRCGRNVDAQYIAEYTAAGVIGLAGKTPYINGVAKTACTAGGGNLAVPLYLMAINNNNTSALYIAESGDYYLAAVVYASTLTAPQMLAVSTAMAAL